jgi:hypothetical protein
VRGELRQQILARLGRPCAGLGEQKRAPRKIVRFLFWSLAKKKSDSGFILRGIFTKILRKPSDKIYREF